LKNPEITGDIKFTTKQAGVKKFTQKTEEKRDILNSHERGPVPII